jgi:hypothetical protein
MIIKSTGKPADRPTLLERAAKRRMEKFAEAKKIKWRREREARTVKITRIAFLHDAIRYGSRDPAQSIILRFADSQKMQDKAKNLAFLRRLGVKDLDKLKFSEGQLAKIKAAGIRPRIRKDCDNNQDCIPCPVSKNCPHKYRFKGEGDGIQMMVDFI